MVKYVSALDIGKATAFDPEQEFWYTHTHMNHQPVNFMWGTFYYAAPWLDRYHTDVRQYHSWYVQFVFAMWLYVLYPFQCDTYDGMGLWLIQNSTYSWYQILHKNTMMNIAKFDTLCRLAHYNMRQDWKLNSFYVKLINVLLI